MASRRYTILIADRTTGTVRRMTLARRPTVTVIALILALPVLVGLGAAWKARLDVTDLATSHAALQMENASYRAATEALAEQIASLQSAVSDIGSNTSMDPSVAKSLDKLPTLVKSRAIGGAIGGNDVQRTAQNAAFASMVNTEDTFGLMRTLLESIESRLSLVRTAVDRRNALAAATPSMWPAHGWLTSRWGLRTDPVNGGADFHPGLDIAGERGQPVYATAAGKITFSAYNGDYGNMIVVDHGFGLQTRYGHLLASKVKVGDEVKKGDQIGQVGATGRATGYHLHYEVLANGRLLNPLQLLTQKPEQK